jgi:hypothetical protein
MFRYVYNTESAKWEIQLLTWGFFWRTVRGLSFDSLVMAKQGVAQRGISEHFREQQPYRHIHVTQEQADEQS